MYILKCVRSFWPFSLKQGNSSYILFWVEMKIYSTLRINPLESVLLFASTLIVLKLLFTHFLISQFHENPDLINLEDIIHPQSIIIDQPIKQTSRTSIARKSLAEKRRRRLLKMQRDGDSSMADSEISESDSDYRECSLLEKYDLLPVDSEDEDLPTFYASSGDKLHPALRQIFLGNYEILLTSARKYVIMGEYQFLSDVRTFYAPRKVLFKLIRVLFPYIHISYSSFLNHSSTIVQPRNRTDLCSICHRHELLQAQIRRRDGELSLQQSEQELKQYESHREKYLTQRARFIEDRSSLTPTQILLMIDYKENIKYPIDRDQEGRDWYCRKQITCLTCLCYKRRESGELEEFVYTFFSNCTKHTGAFTIYCLESLLKETIFDTVTQVIWWSDGGPHFKNREVITKLIHTGFENRGHLSFSVNFFAPSHGKSAVDGIFGFFSHLLHDWLPRRGLKNIDQICTFFRRSCILVELCSKGNRHYYFTMFVFSFTRSILLSHGELMNQPQTRTILG